MVIVWGCCSGLIPIPKMMVLLYLSCRYIILKPEDFQLLLLANTFNSRLIEIMVLVGSCTLSLVIVIIVNRCTFLLKSC